MSVTPDEMASGPRQNPASGELRATDLAATPTKGTEEPSAAKPKGIVTVSGEDVLKSGGSGKDKAVTLGTFTQVAGLRLAAGVGALAAVVTLALIAHALWTLPPAPQLSSQMTKEQLDALISAQKQSYELVLNATTGLFEAVIVKVLLPVFTSILGYIFGAQISRGRD